MHDYNESVAIYLQDRAGSMVMHDYTESEALTIHYDHYICTIHAWESNQVSTSCKVNKGDSELAPTIPHNPAPTPCAPPKSNTKYLDSSDLTDKSHTMRQDMSNSINGSPRVLHLLAFYYDSTTTAQFAFPFLVPDMSMSTSLRDVSSFPIRTCSGEIFDHSAAAQPAVSFCRSRRY